MVISTGYTVTAEPAQQLVHPPPRQSKSAPLKTPVVPITQAASGKPAPSQSAGSDDLADDVNRLRQRKLTIPVQGILPKDLVDTFSATRGDRIHEANDMLAPIGTPVYAVEDGKIEKLFTSKPGGLTIYQFDPDGAYCYYYAHLDQYAAGLRQGMDVKRGDLLGYVGVSGNAGNTPHLHFAIIKLGPERKWWQGTAINPYPILREGVPATGGR